MIHYGQRAAFWNQKLPCGLTGILGISTNTYRRIKYFYLLQIQESPTKRHVVLETMKRAQRIAEECGLNCINVTYDLNIAKDAYAI